MLTSDVQPSQSQIFSRPTLVVEPGVTFSATGHRGPFLESPENFSGMRSHFSIVYILKLNKEVYRYGTLHEGKLCSY